MGVQKDDGVPEQEISKASGGPGSEGKEVAWEAANRGDLSLPPECSHWGEQVACPFF